MTKELREAVEYFNKTSTPIDDHKSLRVLINLAECYLACEGLPDERKFGDGNSDSWNECLNLCRMAMVKVKENIRLCKCRDGEGAMTVRRINDDFHQCPRCGGLLPIGYIADKGVHR